MKYGRTFNFSAGPAMMPEPVLEANYLGWAFGTDIYQ